MPAAGMRRPAIDNRKSTHGGIATTITILIDERTDAGAHQRSGAADLKTYNKTPLGIPASVNITGETYAVVTEAVYSRPAETRIMHECVESFVGDPPKEAPFHPNGTVQAFADGHAKFLSALSQYQSGCDGIDWAWDKAGTCNNLGLQRNAD